MALPLGKLTILVGAGLLGSVIAKEGRLPDVSSFLSGALKIALNQIKRGDSTSSGGKPKNDSSYLMDQVNNLRQELQMLTLHSPVTVVTTASKGAGTYGTIVVVIVVGYGYVWWKGWKLPDLMFATRRSLSDAASAIQKQLENFYSSLGKVKRELSSDIDRVDSSLSEVAVATTNTHAKVSELMHDTTLIGQDVQDVRDAVETLGKKILSIEGKQDFTNVGVTSLYKFVHNMENTLLEGNGQALPSQIAFPSKVAALPSSSEASSSSLSSASVEFPRPVHHSGSISSPKSDGISSSLGFSNGTLAVDQTNDGSSSRCRPMFIQRSRTVSVANSMLLRRNSSKQ